MKQVFAESIAPDKALEILFSRLDSLGVQRLPPEIISVPEAGGRITAGPVFARYSSPFYHSAAMDGYAVRYADTFTASETSPCLLKLGESAVYVDTGDPMPPGFNAVIMIEDVNTIKNTEGTVPNLRTEQSGVVESGLSPAPPNLRTEQGGVVESGLSPAPQYIEIYQPATPYQHVRTIGEDIVATELIIPENHRVRPVDIGAMLASGHLEISVRKRPVVSVIPTGTEIIEPSVVRNRPPEPPEIIEYNSHVLAGLARESGAEAERFAIVRDDLEAIKDAIHRAAALSDVVLINAGSGKGSEDYTHAAIAALGEVLVSGVSIKPGKPLIIGIVGNRPVFGIPGYPVSAYLTFQLFVRPLIMRLAGLSRELPAAGSGESVRAVISRQLASPLGVDEFIRVKVGVVDDKYITTPVGRGAGLLMSLVRADGILRIPADSEGLSAGSEVTVELIRGKEEVRNTIVCIGSHDNALDIMANEIKKNYPEFSLSSAHVGSMGGLTALRKGEAHFAGTHLLDEQTGEYNIPIIKKLLGDKGIVLVNLVYRRQGLLVRKGNPKGIRGFEDLGRDDVLFINRQAGSGTRLLLDHHLKELGINPFVVKGYDREEYTHMAVASAVLTGLADAGLAVLSSAQALGLDFIPVADERYDLAIPREFVDTGKIKIVLDIIRNSADFRSTVEALGGYDTRDMGRVMFES